MPVISRPSGTAAAALLQSSGLNGLVAVLLSMDLPVLMQNLGARSL